MADAKIYYQPAEVTAPGETLEDLLEEHEMAIDGMEVTDKPLLIDGNNEID